MNIKSLLLGSAAALVAVSGARAADAVVVAEPEPVEYVRVCDVYGAGFYYIPGTETCLKVSGYFRYDIAAGDNWGLTNVIDKKDPLDEFGQQNLDDSWYQRARFQLRVDARSDTELGTLRAYLAYNMQFTTEKAKGDYLDPELNRVVSADGSTASYGNQIEHAYLELGGFRAGKTNSYFSTFTDYAGGVIHDDIVSYGPFETHLLSYTYQGDSGFTAGLSLEEGFGKGELVNDFNDDGVADTTIKSGDIYAIDSYMPHVVAGLGYTAGWGGVKVVGAYNSVWEEYAVKARLDADLSETISGFIMAGWKSADEYVVDLNRDGQVDRYVNSPNNFGRWGGDWAVWGGVTAKVSPRAKVNVQISYDAFENFAAVANVGYELVPGLMITPEVGFVDNFDDLADDKDGEVNGFLRLQRNF